MALDFYVWLAYRLHVFDAPLKVSWVALKRQFGEGYSELRFFRRDALPPLRLAMAVYPEAKVDVDLREGLILHPSPPPVLQKRIAAV
jgi:hypothetical protein